MEYLRKVCDLGPRGKALRVYKKSCESDAMIITREKEISVKCFGHLERKGDLSVVERVYAIEGNERKETKRGEHYRLDGRLR